MRPRAFRTFRECGLLIALGIALAGPAAAEEFAVEGHFDLKDDEPNISGMDCMGSAGDQQRLCLLIDDELKKAQFATLTPGRLVVGKTVPLFHKSNPPIVGTEPAKDVWHCSSGKDSGEMDGEGVARDGPYFYVLGSHGCAKNGEFRPETFVLGRINSSGGEPSVERTYRLSEVLLAAGETQNHFGRDLDKGGLSFEGIAARDGRLYLAARVPAVGKDGAGGTFLIDLDAEPLFDDGGTPAATRIETVPLGSFKRGAEDVPIGFRDLEALPDGRFLALTGPMPDGDGLFQLRILDKDFQLVGEALEVTRPPGMSGSPEGIEWLGEKDGVHRVLVLSDGVVDGGPFVVPFKE